MMSYVVVFRGDASTGGYPIAITSAAEPVRIALQEGLKEVWSFTQDVRTDPSLRAKAKGNIQAIQVALEELASEPPIDGSTGE